MRLVTILTIKKNLQKAATLNELILILKASTLKRVLIIDKPGTLEFQAPMLAMFQPFLCWEKNSKLNSIYLYKYSDSSK